jgi:hypothetical protein
MRMKNGDVKDLTGKYTIEKDLGGLVTAASEDILSRIVVSN